MSNYLNSSYTSLNNLVSLYGDSGVIDNIECKSLTIGGLDYTSYNNNLENQITNLQTTDISLQTQINNKVNTSDYGTFNGDVILNQSNTYLSGDTTNFTIKNKYPVYGPNPLVVDSKLLYFYTFETVDLVGSYLKNQATNQYDLLIDSGVVIDGTLNIPSTSDTIGASVLNSSYTLNSSGFTIGLWFQPILPFNSFSRICSLHSTTGHNIDSIFMGVFVNNKLQLTVNNAGTATSINLTTNLISDTLYFLCWVITPTSWTLYVNGTKTVYTTGITFPTNLVKNNTYLGKYPTNSNNITGFIDNFFIYNDILTDSQITDIYSKYNTSGQFYNTVPIKYFEYETLTGYDYTNLLSLDDSGNITNNLTITNLQTTDTSLQTQINNIISSSAGDIKTIIIGTTTTLDSGDSATVVNVGTSQNMILNFGIPRGYRGYSGSDGSKGDKGDKGDTGDTGPKGDAGNSVGIETIIGIIESIITQAEIAAMQAQILALQGQIAIIDEQILVLQAKTFFQSVIGNNTRFTSNLVINSGVSDRINLNQDGTIQAYGKITAVNDDIQCNRLIASDINTSSSNTNINGSTINIGGIGLGNIINIGNLTSFINLIGTVNSTFGFTTQNGFINQFG